MAERESINRVKLEHWRISRVPCNTAEAIFQGDMLCWDVANRRATRLITAASGANFIGMSEKQNFVETAGSTSFLSNTTSPILNVIQSGLVEVIWGVAETVYPFDEVVMDGANAQTCKKGSGSTVVGVVDPGFAVTANVSGRAVASGDLVKIWLQVRTNQYNVHL